MSNGASRASGSSSSNAASSASVAFSSNLHNGAIYNPASNPVVPARSGTMLLSAALAEAALPASAKAKNSAAGAAESAAMPENLSSSSEEIEPSQTHAPGLDLMSSQLFTAPLLAARVMAAAALLLLLGCCYSRIARKV